MQRAMDGHRVQDKEIPVPVLPLILLEKTPPERDLVYSYEEDLLF